MTRSLFFGLLLCNLLWSFNPIMGKLVLADFPPLQAAWLRYTCALLAYIALLGPKFIIPAERSSRLWLLLLGALPFYFSTVLNVHGLSQTYATDNSILIALEPLMTLILAWLLLGETPKPIHAAALGIALAGLYFLSHNDPPGQVQSSGARTLGNILIVLSFIGEGAYSPCSKKLVQKYPAAPLFGSALLIGWLLQTLTVGVLSGLPSPSQFSLKSGFAVLYLGILGTTATYLYWMKSILQAPLAVLVLTLFLQPIAGALWSGLILGETLTAIQWLGGGLILLSMGLEPAFDYFGRPTASPRI